MSGEPTGTSIFPLRCASLAEDILLYIRCVLNDDFLHFQEVKNEKQLANIMDKLSLFGWQCCDAPSTTKGGRSGSLRRTHYRCQGSQALYIPHSQVQQHHR